SQSTPTPTRPPLFPYTTLFRSGSAPLLGRARGGFRGAICARSSENSFPLGKGQSEAKVCALPTIHQDGPLSEVSNSERPPAQPRSEEHTSELQSRSDLVCRLLL